ncbi:hypothetical protein PLICRDRAFT_463240 [Plicaturopsis crispa FD-325 SS-3]|nr:hypothetical protein PLICRDRAFT_463240 [Plicaturopsis crispa FD-325 SS-3]
MAFIARYNPLLPLLFLSCLGTTLATFVYRLYDNDGCVHGGSDNSDTSPPNNESPLPGDPGNCYNAPLGSRAWNKLEIALTSEASNNSCTLRGPFGVVTYCNVDCAQGDSQSDLQTGPDLYCFASPQNCSIGSLYVQLFDI